MKAQIIKIGNSKGIRIPTTILRQCKLDETVNLEIENSKLVITPYKELRANWESSFKQMALNKDDILLDESYLNDLCNDEEWQW